jgi:uncharacterized protein DUF3592
MRCLMLSLHKPQSKRDWLCIVIGAAWLYFSGTQLVMGLWSLAWPTTDGVITYSEPYRAFRTYQVDLRYKYNYHGREYTGDVFRFTFAVDRMRSRQVDSVQARYRVGEPVQVAVNPWNPAQSVLEPGVDDGSFLWPALGSLILLAGFLPGKKERQKDVTPKAPGVASGTSRSDSAVGARKKINPRYGTAKVILVIRAGAFLWGLNTLYAGWSSRSWPTADGKIFYSSARTGGRNYRRQLWYEYNVRGTRYVAENYRVGGNRSPFKDTVKEAAERYPVGHTVKVYYNPSNPSEAVLEPGLCTATSFLPGSESSSSASRI